MEKIAEALTDFLINNLPEYLEELADENTPLPAFTEGNVNMGDIDLDLMKKSQCVYIVPDIQTVTELTMASQQTSTSLDLFVFVRGNKKDVLTRQALRYGAAIKKAMQTDYSINGNFDQCDVIAMEYFGNVEASDSNIKACRLGLQIIQEEMEE